MPFSKASASGAKPATFGELERVSDTQSRSWYTHTGAPLPGEMCLPLTVLAAPSCGVAEVLVATALGDVRVDLLRTTASLTSIDPRAFVDLAVLDVNALDADAYSALDDVRLRWPSAYVICLNVASDTEAAALLELGADSALCGDESTNVLSSVIRAAARRLLRAHAELRITFGDLVLDREARRVWCAALPVALTEREFRLFEHLLLNAGHIVTHRGLAACAWRIDPAIKSNGLAVYVGYLRRKLRRSVLTTLITLRGQGYGLVLRGEARRSVRASLLLGSPRQR